MLKGPAQPENNFFDGEARHDPAAAATASTATNDIRIPHFANGVGPAGTVGGGNSLCAASVESRKFASACIPDGQFDVTRRSEIEEAAKSVSKELGAVQMSEEGGVHAWSKTGNVSGIESQSFGGNGDGGQGGDAHSDADADAASESTVPMDVDIRAGSSTDVSRAGAVGPPALDPTWRLPRIEELPDFVGDVDVAASPGRSNESGSMQRRGDDLLHGLLDNAHGEPAATLGNRDDDYDHSTIPSGGMASVTPSANTNFFDYSSPIATPSYSHVTKENSAPGVFGTNMTKEQFRYCTSVIKNLKRHSSAQPFLKPVDPVALNIPDYPSIIKRPMDLGTVDDKLAKGQYADARVFADDVRLVFQNCYLYNGRQSVYSQMALQLESIFENQMKKVPAASPSVRSASSLLPRAKTARTGAIVPPPVVTPQATPSKPVATPRPRPSSTRKSASSARKLTSKSISASGADRQTRFCSAVLNELCRKQYADINWPFLQPVDPVALNIPEYPTIIKRPMDLSTMRRKLNEGEYASPREFENDINLMFDNCFTFNRTGDPVYTNGEQLREVFRRKWKDLPPPPVSKKAAGKSSVKPANKASVERKKSASVPAIKAKGSDNDVESEDSESEDEKESPAFGNLEQLALMEAHMNMMQKRLEELKNAAAGAKPSKKKKSRSESTPPSGKSKSGKSSKAKASSSSKKPKSETGASGSRRKSASKATGSVEREWEELAAGTATGKGKRDKKRRASEVDFTSSEDDGRGGRARHPSSKKDASSTSAENAKPAAKKAKVAAGPPVILFEHKQQLSEMINSLGEDKLETVIEIIHDSMPHLRGATEEVELDIDALDYGSFYRLYNYVVNDVRPSKKGASGRGTSTGKGKSGRGGKSGGNGGATDLDRSSGGGGGDAGAGSPRSAGADAASGASGSDAAVSVGGAAAAGAEKKKYLSEEEQAQQIMVLEEKLKQFADVVAANTPEEDKPQTLNAESESSDESADSADESSDGSLA